MTTLAVTDDAAARPDLAARIESKYGFARHDVATLREILRRTARPITYAGKVSTVRSVYFDDERLSTCRANLDGVGVRRKFRLRWYDAPAPEHACFFEIKWRRHQTTGKHRFRCDDGARLSRLPLRDVPRAITRALPAGLQALAAPGREPIALIEYRREHYAVDDVRFTLDYDIRCHPLTGRTSLAGRRERFVERLAGFALIECKAPVAGSDVARAVLRPLRARSIRFSKYVTACQRLGLIHTL